MVSRGRSRRGREGLDLSGSTERCSVLGLEFASGIHTNDVAIVVPEFNVTKWYGCGGLTRSDSSCQ